MRAVKGSCINDVNMGEGIEVLKMKDQRRKGPTQGLQHNFRLNLLAKNFFRYHGGTGKVEKQRPIPNKGEG